jgi:hypothetical protein
MRIRLAGFVAPSSPQNFYVGSVYHTGGTPHGPGAPAYGGVWVRRDQAWPVCLRIGAAGPPDGPGVASGCRNHGAGLPQLHRTQRRSQRRSRPVMSCGVMQALDRSGSWYQPGATDAGLGIASGVSFPRTKVEGSATGLCDAAELSSSYPSCSHASKVIAMIQPPPSAQLAGDFCSRPQHPL